jgi:hypothetical protein
VIHRLIEVQHEVSVEPDLRREELGIQDGVVARISIQPREVAVSEW